jgi:hypothetical protein
MLPPSRARNVVPMTSAVQPPARFMPMRGAFTTHKAYRQVHVSTSQVTPQA